MLPTIFTVFLYGFLYHFLSFPAFHAFSIYFSKSFYSSPSVSDRFCTISSGSQTATSQLAGFRNNVDLESGFWIDDWSLMSDATVTSWCMTDQCLGTSWDTPPCACEVWSVFLWYAMRQWTQWTNHCQSDKHVWTGVSSLLHSKVSKHVQDSMSLSWRLINGISPSHTVLKLNIEDDEDGISLSRARTAGGGGAEATELGRSGRSLEDWADSAGAGWLDMEELADSAGAGRLDEDGSGSGAKCRAGSEGPAGSAGAFKSGSGGFVFHIWFLIICRLTVLLRSPFDLSRATRCVEKHAPSLGAGPGTVQIHVQIFSFGRLVSDRAWIFLSSFDLLLLCCLLMIFLDGSYSLSQSTAMTPSTRWGSGSG